MSGLFGRGAMPGGDGCQPLSVDALEATVGAPHSVPFATATMRAENGNVTTLASG